MEWPCISSRRPQDALWTSAGTERPKLGTFISNSAQLCGSSARLLRPSILYGAVRVEQNLHCLQAAHSSGARENRGRRDPLPPAESGGFLNERGLTSCPSPLQPNSATPSLIPHLIGRCHRKWMHGILIEGSTWQSDSPLMSSWTLGPSDDGMPTTDKRLWMRLTRLRHLLKSD